MLLPVFLTLAVLAGCKKDDDAATPLPVPDLTGVSFGYELGAFEPGVTETRSILSGSDIEDRITGITVTVYKEGKRIASRHYTDGFSSMTFDLEEGETYDIYALANMEDRTSFLPADLSASPTSSVAYDVPSHCPVNRNGLAMAALRRP